MRFCLLLLLPLLLASCSSTDSFTQRKYLPGFFHKTKHTERKSAQQHPSAAELIALPSPEKTNSVVEIFPVKTDTGVQHKTIESDRVEINTQVQPTDTIPAEKTKREKRREKMQTDEARSGLSLLFGLYSVITAILFFLLGVWLSRGASPFTEALILIFLLILIVIPLYFLLALTSLVYAIIAIVLARKVQKKNRGQKEYPTKKKTIGGILLAIVGLLIALAAGIFTLPHFLAW